MSINPPSDGRLNPALAESNDSGNPSIHELIARRAMSRRGFFKTSLGGSYN